MYRYFTYLVRRGNRKYLFEEITTNPKFLLFLIDNNVFLFYFVNILRPRIHGLYYLSSCSINNNFANVKSTFFPYHPFFFIFLRICRKYKEITMYAVLVIMDQYSIPHLLILMTVLLTTFVCRFISCF